MFCFRKSLLCSVLALTSPAALGLATAASPASAQAGDRPVETKPAAEKAKRKAADPQALPDAKHRARGEAAEPAASAQPRGAARGEKSKDGATPAEPARAEADKPATPAQPAQGKLDEAVAQRDGAKPAAPAQANAKSGPTCSIEEPEQPRGGQLDLTGSGFGQSPLVRIAGKPTRMIERREDRLSVQVPVDSNGGPVTVQAQGQRETCGTLVIIGKNR